MTKPPFLALSCIGFLASAPAFAADPVAATPKTGVAADPQQRFETAEEWLLVLEQGERQSLSVRPRPLLEREPLKVWRTMALLALLGNVVLLVLLFHS